MTTDTDKQPAPTTAAPAPAILAAIVEITAALGRAGISKDRKNEQQRYSFRGIEDVYAALSPLLAKHRVAVLPHVVQRVETTREAKSGGAIYSVAVEVQYTLTSAIDGSGVHVVTWGEAMDSADKATNKAMSAAFKYMAFTTFCIPVEGQDDADATTPEETKPGKTQPRSAAPAKNGAPKAEPPRSEAMARAGMSVAPPGEKAQPFASVAAAIAAYDDCKDAREFPGLSARVLASKFSDADLIRVREAKDRAKHELPAPGEGA